MQAIEGEFAVRKKLFFRVPSFDDRISFDLDQPLWVNKASDLHNRVGWPNVARALSQRFVSQIALRDGPGNTGRHKSDNRGKKRREEQEWPAPPLSLNEC